MIRVLLALTLAAAPLAAAAQAVTPRPDLPPAPAAPAAVPGAVPPPSAAAPGTTVYAPPPAVLPPRPALPPMSLTGRSDAQVRAQLGEPDVARREAGGALWTYASDSCALLVFFQVQGREGLRVTGASAGPRQRGQGTPELEACIASNRG